MTTGPRFLLPAAALAGGLVIAAAGCGGKPAPSPVSGKLLVKGKEADGALVRLWPAAGDGGDAARPLGYVQSDGTFKLTTNKENDGATPGRYKVTVEWRPKKKSTTEADGPDKLGGRYADPKTSKIEVTVNAGGTTLDPIQID